MQKNAIKEQIRHKTYRKLYVLYVKWRCKSNFVNNNNKYEHIKQPKDTDCQT